MEPDTNQISFIKTLDSHDWFDDYDTCSPCLYSVLMSRYKSCQYNFSRRICMLCFLICAYTIIIGLPCRIFYFLMNTRIFWHFMLLVHRFMMRGNLIVFLQLRGLNLLALTTVILVCLITLLSLFPPPTFFLFWWNGIWLHLVIVFQIKSFWCLICLFSSTSPVGCVFYFYFCFHFLYIFPVSSLIFFIFLILLHGYIITFSNPICTL